MTKADIVANIAEDTGLERVEVLKAVESFMNSVKSSLANGDNVVALPFIVESIFLSSELMQSDQTHPNASAQPLLLDVVWPTLSSLLGMTDHE